MPKPRRYDLGELWIWIWLQDNGVTAQQIAVTQPQAWDLYDQWFNSVKIVWGAGQDPCGSQPPSAGMQVPIGGSP